MDGYDVLFFTKDNVDFKLISLNVRGIRFATKRKALLLWLNKQKADIVFLQETYSTKEVEPVWNTQWKGKMFYSHGTNHSCGVLVLVRDDLEFKLNSSRTDDKGRFILIDATVQGSEFLFVNVYSPNKVPDQCSFFNNLNSLLENYYNIVEQKIVLGGDFNVALSTDLDCSGGNPMKKDSLSYIQNICFDLI